MVKGVVFQCEVSLIYRKGKPSLRMKFYIYMLDIYIYRLDI